MRVFNQLYDITPTKEFYLIGYGDKFESRRKPAEGIHDSIFANVMLIEVDGRLCYIFNADFIEFEESFCEEMKSKISESINIDPRAIFFSATHNHSSIMGYHKKWKSGKFDPDYHQKIQSLIMSSVNEAVQKLTPVHAYCRRVIIKDYYGSRIFEGNPGDKEVIIIEFRDETGKAIAGICNYALHSTVLGPRNTMLSSELAGNVRQKLENQFGYSPLMIVGAAADMSNRHFRQGDDFEELQRVSTGIADQLLKEASNVPLNIATMTISEISYQVTYDMKPLHQEILDKIGNIEKKIKDEKNKDKLKILNSEIGGCKFKLGYNEVDFTLKSSIIKMNDLMFISIPGELYSQFGIEIKKTMDSCCLIFGYTNGHHYYMMPKDLYGKTFESQLSLMRAGDVEEYVKLLIDEARRK